VAALRLLAVFARAFAARPDPSPVSSGYSSASMILSVVAIVVSVLALATAIWIARRQTLAQAALAAIDQARRTGEGGAQAPQARQAQSATVIVQWRDSDPALILHNRGHAPALDVTVEVTSATPGGLPPRLPAEDGCLATERLDPGRSHAIPVTAPYGLAAVIQVTVRWRDGAGPHQDVVRLPTVGQ
jgi:hypothetical protein